MDQNIVQYCDSLGKSLNERSNFCGGCGRNVQQQDPASATPPLYPPVSALQPIAAQQPVGNILAALQKGMSS